MSKYLITALSTSHKQVAKSRRYSAAVLQNVSEQQSGGWCVLTWSHTTSQRRLVFITPRRRLGHGVWVQRTRTHTHTYTHPASDVNGHTHTHTHRARSVSVSFTCYRHTPTHLHTSREIPGSRKILRLEKVLRQTATSGGWHPHRDYWWQLSGNRVTLFDPVGGEELASRLLVSFDIFWFTRQQAVAS